MSARLISYEAQVVGLDYGHYALRSALGEDNDETAVVASAVASDGIGQQRGLLVIVSPHQNNLAMEITVEIWDSAPVDDLPEWQEAFEAHLDVEHHGLIYESPTMPAVQFSVPPGGYHAVIAGRGFKTIGWPGSVTPGDHWRIRLWPSSELIRARRLRRFDAPPMPQRPESYKAARDAARRINADLSGSPNARSLADQTGVASARLTYSRPRPRLFALLADLSQWTSASASRSRQIVCGGGYWLFANAERENFDCIPTGPGMIQATYVQLDEPRSIATEWIWLESADFNRPRTPILSEPTLLRTTLEWTARSDGTTELAVGIAHIGLPTPWVVDMSHIWEFKLSAGRTLIEA